VLKPDFRPDYMRTIQYRGRRAARLENEHLRVTLTIEGGHIAEILDKATGVNPLWTPPWKSIEPFDYTFERYPEYGSGPEAKLLAGIMGHNLCLDVFGGPSPEEATAGITVHGEASVAAYDADMTGDTLTMRVTLLHAQLAVERTLTLEGHSVHIMESVENLGAFDRPIAWTQHVTLGSPFLEAGATRFDLTAGRSKTYESEFGDLYTTGVEFDWPHAPTRQQGNLDLRTYPDVAESAGYTAHLMNPQLEHAWFTASSPSSGVLFGYRWRREDFPWCGIWEENRSRKQTPWNGQTIARGFEFGVSPMPETRRQMIERGTLFGVPAYRWLPARTLVTVNYEARIMRSGSNDPATLFA
jgi:hypothetical protein